MSCWQTTWNKKFYDYKRLVADFKEGRTLEIKNSKGMAKMNVVPRVGDLVFVSCDKKKIMACSVISEFEVAEGGGYDEYCINVKGSSRHMNNNTFLRLKITEVYDKCDVMLGQQRTWVKLK
jgi:hypothetical protein